MVNKNVNFGTVDTGGGDAHIGDIKYITNVFEGLSLLLFEYQAQLKKINSLILEFSPKIAFDLLIELENRVRESSPTRNNTIESKILFLKALCKSELQNFSKKESALDFIKAYNLNNDDEELKIRACVEYLNIDNKTTAIELADDILTLDIYNLTAWFVKTVTSDDIKSYLQSIPKIVFDNYNFQHNVIYTLFQKKHNGFKELKNYGLQLSFNFDKYKGVTFENKQAWIIDLDLLISTIVNKANNKYIAGDTFIIENDSEIFKAIKLLEFFTNSLETTEISNSTKNQKFHLNYLKYLSSNNEASFKLLGQLYNEVERTNWVYTLFYCQIANHKKEFRLSLDCLVAYEKFNGELHSDFFLFKSVALHFLSKEEEICVLYDEYLNSIDLIDERHLFNLINAFFNIPQHFDDNSKFLIQLDKVLEKKFILDDLKILLKVTVELRYIKIYDKAEVFNSLNAIKDNNQFDDNCKRLIAENFDMISKSIEALSFLDSYIDKTVISDSLKAYIFILHSLLKSKEDTPKGKSSELLVLLKFWRCESNYVDENLLRIEHDLYSKIGDLIYLEEIDKLLYSNFPDNMLYLYFYLAVLERRYHFAKLKKISISIPTTYKDESLGIAISGILLRHRNNTNKGFEILYNLALDQNNTEARQNYFAGSLLFNEHFESYDSVSLGNWVKHNVDGKEEKRKIVKSEGIQKDFLGKKIGEIFTNVNSLTNKESKIEIIEIFNDALNLFRDIGDEAHNPINELGFISLQIPPDISDLPKFLVEQFGANGTVEKNRTDKLLDDYYNYRIGYLVVVNAVFKSKFIDAYIHLTCNPDSRFTTIPNSFTADLNKENNQVKFVLDFTSLMLFYYLERDLYFKFNDKFVVSYNTKAQIENEISEVVNSPESTLSVNITSNGIENHVYAEGIKNKRIEFLQSIANWIDNNCEIDLVSEKLDVVLKLPKKERKVDNAIMTNLIDSLHLSIRENHRFISSDVSTFLFESNKINNNFLNPEKYLLTYFPENCNSDFYRFLLKSNYIGIDISLNTLIDEFISFIANKENYYLSALENLQFSINNNPDIIITCVQFLKYLYLDNSISIIDKNRYASQIFRNTFNGMTLDLINQYQAILITHFKLLVDYYDAVLKEFNLEKKIYLKD